jgi:hypothetical protein
MDEWWIAKDLEGSGRGLLEVLLRQILEGLRNAMRTSVRRGSVPAEILIPSLTNRSLESYRYASHTAFPLPAELSSDIPFIISNINLSTRFQFSIQGSKTPSYL